MPGKPNSYLKSMIVDLPKTSKVRLMIEREENLDAILKVDNLDAIFIGPYDLSASMGITGQFENSKFKSIIGKIKKKARHASVPCGIHVVEPSESDLRRKIDDGYSFIAYSIDSVIISKFIKRPFS